MKKFFLTLSLGVFTVSAFAAERSSSPSQLTLDPVPLPEGCGKAIQDGISFAEFFEATASVIAAQKGHQAKGVVDLFSTLEIRKQIGIRLPLSSAEAMIDQLISIQICGHQSFRARQLRPGALQALAITSYDSQIQQHLLEIAPRLLTDAKKILNEAMSVEKQREAKKKELQSRLNEVEKAREAAQSSIENLF